MTVQFQPLMVKNLRYKCCINQTTNCDNGNVQSQDQEESKLNSTIIIVNSGAHAFTDEKITKSQFNKTNVATVKNK